MEKKLYTKFVQRVLLFAEVGFGEILESLRRKLIQVLMKLQYSLYFQIPGFEAFVTGLIFHYELLLDRLGFYYILKFCLFTYNSRHQSFQMNTTSLYFLGFDTFAATLSLLTFNCLYL